MKAYSYLRYSTDRQQYGDSERRQLDESAKYALENGLELDTEASFKDLGVSAYRGSNLKKGALGDFIQGVKDGQIQTPATLIIETIDRLSRDRLLDALSLFIELLNLDLTLVTLIDKQVYTRQSVSENPYQLIISITLMYSANQYSVNLGYRVKNAWNNKLNKAKNHGIPLTKKLPFWLCLEPNDQGKDVYQFTSEVHTLRIIFDLYEQGKGYNLIAQYLNQHHPLPVNRKSARHPKWQEARIKDLLEDEKCIGNYIIYDEVEELDENGDKKMIKHYPKDETNILTGFYPAAITQRQWLAVHALKDDKAKSRASGGRKSTNMLAHIGKCECGSPLVIDKRYYTCRAKRYDKNSCSSTRWNVDDLNRRLLTFIRDLDVSLIFPDGDKRHTENLRSTITALEHELLDVQRKQKNLITDLGDEDDATIRKQYRDKLKELNATEERKHNALIDLMAELRKEDTKVDNILATQDKIRRLRDSIDDDDNKTIVNHALQKIAKWIMVKLEDKSFGVVYKDNRMIIHRTDGTYLYLPIDDDRSELPAYGPAIRIFAKWDKEKTL
jgi:DNA invertase Pin-like site-specific DNA recombinase